MEVLNKCIYSYWVLVVLYYGQPFGALLFIILLNKLHKLMLQQKLKVFFLKKNIE